MKVRPIEDRDVEGIVALWESCGLLRPWNDPRRDIERARAAPQSEIFVIPGRRSIVASVMAGNDGHRGWLYYVAVAPERRGNGLARKIVAHAEGWLRERDVPKVELMIRAGNPIGAFYRAVGYEREAREVMARWLVDPPVCEHAPQIDVTITYLEMREAPSRPTSHPPRLRQKIALLRAETPSVGYYRFLYNAVGAAWSWYERNQMSDAELTAIIQDDRVEIYVLYLGGAPAGYIELDRREPAEAELAYFGLVPDCIGIGLGGYMLDWAIDTAWSHPIERLWVHTCTLDHPSALPLYQKAGFVPYRQETVAIPDPRSMAGS